MLFITSMKTKYALLLLAIASTSSYAADFEWNPSAGQSHLEEDQGSRSERLAQMAAQTFHEWNHTLFNAGMRNAVSNLEKDGFKQKKNGTVAMPIGHNQDGELAFIASSSYESGTKTRYVVGTLIFSEVDGALLGW